MLLGEFSSIFLKWVGKAAVVTGQQGINTSKLSFGLKNEFSHPPVDVSLERPLSIALDGFTNLPGLHAPRCTKMCCKIA